LAKLQNDLKEFIALLNSHAAEYLVVGGRDKDLSDVKTLLAVVARRGPA
jgi:hypothetical protein